MTTWKIGDRFRILTTNPYGGAAFGAEGDVGEVTRICDREVSFRYISINEKNQLELADRLHYLFKHENFDGKPTIGITTNCIEPLVKEYKADQVADEEEDLL